MEIRILIMSQDNRMGLLGKLIHWIFKTIFHLLYHQFAWTYDWIADIVSIGRWNEWIHLATPYLYEPPILELGHGPGHLQVTLHKKGKRVYGIDASRQMIGIAKKRLHDEGCSALLVQGKSECLPYPTNNFRFVVATFPSEFIIKPETLCEIWRVLNDKGELIIVATAWITGDKIMDRMAAWLFRVTGQAPDKAIAEIQEWYSQKFDSIQDIKYRIKTHLIELETSEVLLIQAIKDTS